MILASVGHCAPDKCQCLSLASPTMEQVVEDLQFEIMVTKHDEASQRLQFAPLPVCWFCCLFGRSGRSRRVFLFAAHNARDIQRV